MGHIPPEYLRWELIPGFLDLSENTSFGGEGA